MPHRHERNGTKALDWRGARSATFAMQDLGAEQLCSFPPAQVKDAREEPSSWQEGARPRMCTPHICCSAQQEKASS